MSTTSKPGTCFNSRCHSEITANELQDPVAWTKSVVRVRSRNLRLPSLGT
ncbi:MAG: CxxxxCH/CxxCH domain-containing protein [Sedimentisphaerales bacterium]|nr:CxxxxCH/CxxCH domain-containing protein [Sedimentisphaerales bacterium]